MYEAGHRIMTAPHAQYMTHAGGSVRKGPLGTCEEYFRGLKQWRKHQAQQVLGSDPFIFTDHLSDFRGVTYGSQFPHL